MGIIEIIKSLQQKKVEQTIADEEAKRIEQLEREQFIRERRLLEDKILNESGVLEGLKRIHDELLANYSGEHVLVHSGGKATLAWGSGFKISGGGVSPDGSCHYSSVEVNIDITGEGLHIRGRQSTTLKKKEWRNVERVNEVLASAYFDPEETDLYVPLHDF